MPLRGDAEGMNLSGEITIEAPADSIWRILGHGFASIGDWATAIQASHGAAGTPTPGAPVAGRTCETGLHAIPTVTENIVAYDDANRTLTYAATELPRFIGEARNRWQVTDAGPGRARARFDGVLKTRGLGGLLAALPLRVYLRRETMRVLDDLKHYAEHGTPSANKQRRPSRAVAVQR